MDRTTAIEALDGLHAAFGAFYAGGPVEPVRQCLTEDIAWHIPGDNAIAGHYKGLDAVLAYFSRRRTWLPAPSGCIPASCWWATNTWRCRRTGRP